MYAGFWCFLRWPKLFFLIDPVCALLAFPFDLAGTIRER
jgi:hypothetical protein